MCQLLGGQVMKTRWAFCECFALKREQAPSPQKLFCLSSALTIQLLQEHHHLLLGLLVAVGPGGLACCW